MSHSYTQHDNLTMQYDIPHNTAVGANKWKQKVKTYAITDRAQWNYKLYSDARASCSFPTSSAKRAAHVHFILSTVHGAAYATICFRSNALS